MKVLRVLPFLIGAASVAAAEGSFEPHLDIVPRTPGEEARVVAVLEADPGVLSPFEHLPLGAATVLDADGDEVFMRAFANLPEDRELDFLVGRSLFRKLWVSSPSSTKASDGLGPLYNARSCLACHPGNGRGVVPDAGERPLSLVLKMTDGAGGKDPIYGLQLQTNSVSGLAAEAVMRVETRQEIVTLADGTEVVMHHPTYQVSDLAQGELAAPDRISPRIAPQVPGLGMVEVIRAEDILALADPEDADGDGISGRARIVHSLEYDQPMIGRFGRKAGTPTIKQQTADAFSHDIGISTPMFPAAWGDCTEEQVDCRGLPHGDKDVRGFEVDGKALDLVTLYGVHLGMPARRDTGDAQVLAGKALFSEIGCADCHQPAFVTHRLNDDPSRSFQLIWPYSDFLLHDMGEGLADGGIEGDVDAQEWKTPPLWGIGRTAEVSGRESYLHDGRARSLLEAVLWHGGEAQAVRDRVVALSTDDREALIRFLESL